MFYVSDIIMARTLCFIFFLTLSFSTISVNASSVIDSLHREIVSAGLDGSEERIFACYQQLNNIYDSLYSDINSRQVEDLRRIYFVDEMEIEQARHQVSMLRILLLAMMILALALFVGFFVLKQQKRRLKISRACLEEAKDRVSASLHNKSLYLSNMSHEIRTPLNALTGFSAILSEPLMDDDTRKQCRDLIRFNADLLLNLINDVVDISCLDINNMSFQVKPVEVMDLCRRVVQTLEGIKHTQAHITFSSYTENLIIETDEVRLQQILINMLVNASKYTPSGSIELSLSEHGDNMVAFAVTDTGCGVPEESHSTLFERYTTLDNRVKGTGIGLSLCKLIVNRLGGDIWIDSEYKSGARFVFTHPISSRT